MLQSHRELYYNIILMVLDFVRLSKDPSEPLKGIRNTRINVQQKKVYKFR